MQIDKMLKGKDNRAPAGLVDEPIGSTGVGYGNY